MAGKGVVALLVVCLIFFAAVQVPRASVNDAVFAQCFKECDETCKSEGMGQTFCEMKCDTDCFNEEFPAHLHCKANLCWDEILICYSHIR